MEINGPSPSPEEKRELVRSKIAQEAIDAAWRAEKLDKILESQGDSRASLVLHAIVVIFKETMPGMSHPNEKVLQESAEILNKICDEFNYDARKSAVTQEDLAIIRQAIDKYEALKANLINDVIVDTQNLLPLGGTSIAGNPFLRKAVESKDELSVRDELRRSLRELKLMKQDMEEKPGEPVVPEDIQFITLQIEVVQAILGE